MLFRSVLGATAMVVLLWPDRGVVPLFDGWTFARCALGVPGISVRCAGHPSSGWGVVMVLGKLVTVPGATPLFLPGLVFGVIALAGLDRLATTLLGVEARWERALLVVTFAVHPVLLSTVLQPNLDLALTAWTFWMLAGVARVRLWEVVGFGALTIFAKETGLLLYGAAGLLMWRDSLPRRDGVRTAAALALPLLLFAGFLLLPQPEPMYVAAGKVATSSNFHPFDLWNRQLLNYGVLIGVLDYQWVMVVALGAMLVAAWRAGDVRWSGPVTRVLATVTLGVGLVTSYRTFGNARYFAFVLPLIPLAMLVAARTARVPRWIGPGLLAGWALLLLTAARHSTDPVMTRIAGTFSTGRGTMYDMTHVPRACCGTGRDHLVYTLQYADFARAMDSAMVRIDARHGVEVAMSRYAHWYAVTPVDVATSRRTLGAGVEVPLHYTEALASGVDTVAHAWLIEWPITVPERESLQERYAIRDAGTVSAGGVTLRLAEMTRRVDVAP